MQAPRWSARALSVLSLCLGVAACGKSPSPPTKFGVNLVVKLEGAIRSRAKSVTVHVGGAEAFDKELAAGVFVDGEARVHYVPHVQAGMLTFAAEAFDSSKAVVGTGVSAPVVLMAGRAVAATVEVHGTGMIGDAAADGPVDGPRGDAGATDAPPNDGGTTERDAVADAGGRGNKGDSCSQMEACGAGLSCADGVCCDSACADPCSACNLAGREGTCSPIASGMMPATGHPACAVDAPSTCKKDGTCDGKGACRLHPVGTVCRASTCDKTTDAFTPEFKCDGAGFCHERGHPLRTLQVQGHERLLRHLHRQHAVRDQQNLYEQFVRPQVARSDLRDRARVREWFLRGRGVLRQGLPGGLRVVQSAHHAWHVHQRSSRPGSEGALPGRNGRERRLLAWGMPGDRRRPLPQSGHLHGLPGRQLRERDGYEPSDVSGERALPHHRPDLLRRLHLWHHQLQHALYRRRPMRERLLLRLE